MKLDPMIGVEQAEKSKRAAEERRAVEWRPLYLIAFIPICIILAIIIAAFVRG